MNSKIRAAIREAMANQGLTQVDLAKQLGISPPALSQVLSGKRGTMPDSLMDILRALGLTLAAVPLEITGEGG